MAFFVARKSAGPTVDTVPLTYDTPYDYAGYLIAHDGTVGNGSVSGKIVASAIG
jgi:hypothetical protein